MEVPADSSSSVVTLATNTIDNKLQNTLDLGSKALNSAEAQRILSAYGLQDYAKNIKQENVRNFLALAGSWYIISNGKKHWKWVLGGFAALYLYAQTTSEEPTNNTIANNNTTTTNTVSGYNDSMY